MTAKEQWVIVPAIATMAMRQAGVDQETQWVDAGQIWLAMVAAAPIPDSDRRMTADLKALQPCPNCNGRLWVCENHPTQTNWEKCCGVGMQCGVCCREEIIRGAVFHAEKRIAELEAALFDANGAFLTIYAGLRGDRPTNRLNAAKGIAFEQMNKIAAFRQALSQSPSQGDAS